jgi:type II secretion system protein N
MAIRLPNLGPRARKVLRYAGFAALGLVTFVLAFQLTFPFDRVKDKVIELLSEKYEVTIGSVDRGLVPGRMSFKAVSLRTRPAKADDVATTFYIEELDIGLGLFALLRGTAAVELDAKIGSGHIAGHIALSKDGTSIDLAGDDLPSASLPMREVLGLPMSGKVRFSFDLELPNEKTKAGKVASNWRKAEGRAELACPSGCTVGDGKTKLKVNLKNQRQQAMVEGGIDFGKVDIDSLLAAVEIKNGKLDITKFDAKSGDGELHIDFGMAIDQEFNQSLVTGCLRFRGSEVLLKREPKTHAALSTTGGPLGPDNLFHIKLAGPLREVRRLPQICGSAANTNMDNPGGMTARPNLTITPDTPATPPGAAIVPSPPPVPAPPAAAVLEGAGGEVPPAGGGLPTPSGGGQPTPGGGGQPTPGGGEAPPPGGGEAPPSGGGGLPTPGGGGLPTPGGGGLPTPGVGEPPPPAPVRQPPPLPPTGPNGERVPPPYGWQ